MANTYPRKVKLGDVIIKNEIPPESPNCSRLDFTTSKEFLPASLEIFMDGTKLNLNDYSIGGDNQSFSIILAPNDPNGIDKAPADDEVIEVNYFCMNNLCI